MWQGNAGLGQASALPCVLDDICGAPEPVPIQRALSAASQCSRATGQSAETVSHGGARVAADDAVAPRDLSSAACSVPGFAAGGLSDAPQRRAAVRHTGHVRAAPE